MYQVFILTGPEDNLKMQRLGRAGTRTYAIETARTELKVYPQEGQLIIQEIVVLLGVLF